MAPSIRIEKRGGANQDAPPRLCLVVMMRWRGIGKTRGAVTLAVPLKWAMVVTGTMTMMVVQARGVMSKETGQGRSAAPALKVRRHLCHFSIVALSRV